MATSSHGQPTAPPTPIARSTGTVTGVIGLVFAFIALAPFGLVLSIISTVQASKSQSSKTLGILGIIFNSLAIVAMILAVIFGTALFRFGIDGVEKDQQAFVQMISDKAEEYHKTNGSYPAYASEISVKNDTYSLVEYAPVDETTIQYVMCGEGTGARISYKKLLAERPTTSYLGDGASTCSDF